MISWDRGDLETIRACVKRLGDGLSWWVEDCREGTGRRDMAMFSAGSLMGGLSRMGRPSCLLARGDGTWLAVGFPSEAARFDSQNPSKGVLVTPSDTVYPVTMGGVPEWLFSSEEVGTTMSERGFFTAGFESSEMDSSLPRAPSPGPGRSGGL